MNASSMLNVLGDAAIKSAVILLIASLLTLSMRRSSAALRHLVWTVAVAIALLLPLGSALLPGYRIPLLPAAPVSGPQPSETVTRAVPVPVADAIAPPVDANPSEDRSSAATKDNIAAVRGSRTISVFAGFFTDSNRRRCPCQAAHPCQRASTCDVDLVPRSDKRDGILVDRIRRCPKAPPCRSSY